MYKVSFKCIDTRRGLIESYRTAARAKEVVERTNSTTDKHGVVATYLGRDK